MTEHDNDTSRDGGESPTLPPDVAALLDGGRLDDHVGETFLLIASRDGDWPHVAMLSVGEVLATDASHLRLVLYSGSGTTAAVVASGRALLLLVCNGTAYKLSLALTSRPLPDGASRAFHAFDADLVDCRRDEVGYARILHGIEYELTDPATTVARWREQLGWLTEAGGAPT